MNHAVQPLAVRGIVEYELPQSRTVDAAVQAAHALAKKGNDRRHRLAFRRFQSVNHIIRVKNINSQLAKVMGKETLAACNAARYGYAHHHAESRHLAGGPETGPDHTTRRHRLVMREVSHPTVRHPRLNASDLTAECDTFRLRSVESRLPRSAK